MGVLDGITIKDSNSVERKVECFRSLESGLTVYGQIVRRRMADTWANMDGLTIDTGVTLLLSSNVNRLRYIIYNNSDAIIYLGGTSGMTAAGGIPVHPAQHWVDTDYTGDVYGCAAAAGSNIRRGEFTND